MNVITTVRRRAGLTGIALVIAGGLALAACGGDDGAAGKGPDAYPAASVPATHTSMPTPHPTIALTANAAIGQKVLVDSKGRTLYLFVPDGTATQSTVPAEFKPNWPPVIADDTSLAGMGLDTAKLGVQPQADGTKQVTYNGHLLYTFIKDTQPGDANGQGLGPNNWFALDADGNPIGVPQPTIALAQNAAIGQEVLVDSKGRTLYLFVPDGTATQSTVPAEFKPNWPPVVADGTPLAGPGLDMAELGVQQQADGTKQVTYDGHLLYTFIKDEDAGDAYGQGLGPNNWFVLDANGSAIRGM
jgi:predicted lipoprotein with Yx(FWY)xxD motif